MPKLCLLYNIAPKYREGIFTLIDKEFDCKWYFGCNDTDIKGLDYSLLKDVTELEVRRLPVKPFTWQKGALALLDNPEFHTFFILGDVFSLSTWALLLKHKLRHRNKRIYLWTHGWYGKESAIRRWLKKRFFRASNGVFLYGNYARELMISEGFDPSTLFVIHNSLSHSKQLELRRKLSLTSIFKEQFGNNNANLIFIGRLTPVKRIDLLIKAMDILREKGVQCNLTFVGDGSAKAEIEALVDEMHLSERVWFYGSCYDDNLNAELIYNADVCVSPGNVGLTAIHAMTFGTPVITHSNFPYQMPEFEAITENVTGAFFEYNNAASLAAVTANWLKDNAARREEIRQTCFREIDTKWTPEFQMKVIRENLKF